MAALIGQPTQMLTKFVYKTMAEEHKAFDKARMSRFWGKVKNYVANAISGLYTKPSGGIPKSDLSSEVQTSLGKADTALQSHQDISGKQDVISDLATIRSGAALGATAIQQHQDISGKQDAINDLADIRSGAALGATALQEHQPLKTLNGTSLVGSGNISIDTSSAYRIRVSMMNPIFKETLYRGAICFRYSETEWLPSARESGTGTDKELTTLDFDPFGQIFYYGSNTTIPVGTSVNAAYLYQQYGFDFRYAFNAGNTLTPYKAVYVKCEPLVDGSNNRTGRVRLASQPIVQDLPTTADGFVYIYLGQATSERSIFILLNHPVYEYRNGGIKLWIGD